MLKKIITPYCVLAYCLLFALPTLLAQGVWTQKANMPCTGREDAVGFSIGNYGYVGTGLEIINNTGYTSCGFWEWNQLTNTWMQKASFPGTPRAGAVGFSIGQYGYIGTGADGSLWPPEFWEWDQGTNTWLRKADYAGVGLGYGVGFSIDAKGYIGLGMNSNSTVDDFWEWDQYSDTWTQKANFPGSARINSTAFSYGRKGYVGWGTGPYTANLNDFWEWDQLSNTWTQINFFPTNIQQAAVFVLDGKAYLGTGLPPSYYPTNKFYEWDLTTNIITQKASFGGGLRFGAVGFAIEERGYFATGRDALGNQKNDLWEYNPDSMLASNDFPLSIATAKIYPNPCKGELTVHSETANALIILYDPSGKKILEKKSGFPEEKIPLSGLTKGIYLLEIRDETKSSFEKILLN